MIAAYGTQLLDWLNKYTYPTELKYADKEFARDVARVFLQENLRNGITTSCVYCTVHPQSVDALFEEAEKLGLRLAAGKVLMDRNAPDGLRDTAQSGYDESQALIAKWHGRGRLLYAITPRFAGTSSPEQLAAAGRLWREHPECLMQTHMAENRDEVAWIRELFPDRRNYLDIYDHHGLCGQRAVFGHGIWLEEAELQRLHASGAAIAHCPTSNFFLGSGAFDLARALRSERPVRVGLGTDIGAGTSFSILATLGAAYKAAQLNRQTLSAGHAYYLATRGGGPRPLSRRPDRQHRARHGGRPRGARHALHAADRFPHEPGQRLCRAALHPDDPGRRPRRAGDLRGRPAGLRAPALFQPPEPLPSVKFGWRAINMVAAPPQSG